MRKVLAAAALVVAACGGSHKHAALGGDTKGLQSGDATGDLKIPKVDASLCDTKDKEVAQFDINRDDKPDVWKLFKKVSEKGTTLKILTCQQVDFDHDGRKDMVVRYDDNGAVLDKEYDFDFDGRFDARFFFDKKTGQRYLAERDTGFDGKPDEWEKYTPGGQVDSVYRDRNGDGKPDYWEQYQDGRIVVILYDDDFDGKVDRQDKSTTVTAPAGGTTGTPPSPGPGGAATDAPGGAPAPSATGSRS